jgi:hypothetical protein
MNGSDEASQSRQPTAFAVGIKFIKAYYRVLETNPEQLWTFYHDTESVVAHLEKDHPFSRQDSNAQGRLNIQKKISSTFASAAFKVAQIDVQETIAGGVLLLVTGELSGRQFVHTFVLASKKEHEQLLYYIKNEVLRFLSEAQPKHEKEEKAVHRARHDSVEVDDTKVVAQAEPEAPAVKETPVAPAPAPAVAAPAATQPEPQQPAAAAPVQQPRRQRARRPRGGGADKEKDVSKDADKPAAPVEPKREQQPEQPKKPTSWAKAVGHANNTTHAPAAPAANAPKESQPEPAKVEAAPAAAPAGAAPAVAGVALFVKGLPNGTTKAELEEVFKRFGAITSSEIPPYKNYGFINFTNPDVVDIVLREQKITLPNGSELRVDKKRDFPREPRTSGRGGAVGGGLYKPRGIHNGDSDGFRGARGGRGAPRGGRGRGGRGRGPSRGAPVSSTS